MKKEELFIKFRKESIYLEIGETFNKEAMKVTWLIMKGIYEIK